MITFRGQTIMSAGDGDFRFQMGLFPRQVVAEPVIGGVVVKVGCQAEARHRLTLNFNSASTNSATKYSNIYGRLQDLWDGVGGTLVVPDFPSMSNCFIVNVTPAEQVRTQKATAAGSSLSDGVDVEIVVEFIQI